MYWWTPRCNGWNGMRSFSGGGGWPVAGGVMKVGPMGFPPHIRNPKRWLETIRCLSCRKLCDCKNIYMLSHYLSQHAYLGDLYTIKQQSLIYTFISMFSPCVYLCLFICTHIYIHVQFYTHFRSHFGSILVQGCWIQGSSQLSTVELNKHGVW